MRLLIAITLATVLAGCPSPKCGPSGDQCGWSYDGGPYEGSCPGTVTVDDGMLAGGAPGQAVASSSFGPLGARIILATTAAVGCAKETGFGSPSVAGGDVAEVLITLAPGLSPGTYALASDAGALIWPTLAFSTPAISGGADIVSGTLTLDFVDPSRGVQGAYHLDFGRSSFAGGGGTLNDGGVVFSGPLGELIEDGFFSAPPCELCPSPPSCGDAGCAAGEICLRGGGCDQTSAVCQPAPSCGDGPPSCDTCAFDGGATCGSDFGQGCFDFDGFSLVCVCFP